MTWRLDHDILKQFSPLMQRLEDKKNQLDQARPLPSFIVEKIKSEMSLEWTFHSNHIEGNTLSLNETRVVLEDGMTIKGKSLREHFEIINHHEAIDFVTSLINPDYRMTESDILNVHKIVMTKIERDFGGRYRNGGVRISGANFIPPNAIKINDLMQTLVDRVNASVSDWPPIFLATIFHHHFVHIHPFFDGNGRTVRLMMNVLLMNAGYPPAIILHQDRKKYYEGLNQANQGQYTKLFLLILQAVERSLNIYLHAFPSKNADDDFALISDIVSDTSVPYGQEYISLLARKGLIDAYKEGRNWLTKKSVIIQYWHNHRGKN